MTTSGTFVYEDDLQSGDEELYDAPRIAPRTGTEIIHVSSADAESSIDTRSAFPPNEDVIVGDAFVTAFVGDGRLADVRRRRDAQERADAIVASGALGFPAIESHVAREARELEEQVITPSAPVTDLRQKITGKCAAGAKALHAQRASSNPNLKF